jgi:putative membrane protein
MLRPSHLIAVVTLAVLIAGITGCGTREGADWTSGDTASPPPLPPAEARISDGSIVASLADANQTTVTMARTAQPRARSAGARELAQRALEEHTRMQRTLDSLATAKNIARQAPVARDAMDAAIATRTAGVLSAPEAAFDTAYVNTQLALDTQFLENVTRLASAAEDEDLRRLLRSWMPVVQSRISRGLTIQGRLTR